MSKLVKKLLSLVLVVAMSTSTTAVLAGSTDGNYDPYPIVSQIDLGSALTDPSITAWGGYMFVAHGNGIKVVDLQTEETVADWTLNSSVIPGVSKFATKQIFVDDRYIIASQGTADSAGGVVVFENTKRFDNTPPKLIRRFAHSKMRDVKKIYADEDYLYILNISSSMLEGWKIPLADLESLPNTGSAANKYTELKANNNGAYEQFTTSKVYDRIWSDVEISDNIAYVPVFNDETNAPYKSVMMLAVDLDNFSEDNMITNIVAEGDIDALKTRFITTTITDSQVRNNLKIHLVSQPEVEVELNTRSFSRSELRMGMIELGSEYSVVTMYFPNLAKVAEKLGTTEELLKSGEEVVAITVDDVEYEFDFTQKVDVSFPDGSFILSGSNFYLLTNSDRAPSETTFNDYAFHGSLVQGICDDVAGSPLLIHNNGSGFTTATMTDNGHILGFLDGSNTVVYGIDVADLTSEDYLGTYHVSQYTGDVMATANAYSDLVEYNGSFYYISRTRSKIIRLGGGSPDESVDMVQYENTLPVVLHGTTASDADVTVTIDGTDITVPVQNNMWRLPVVAQPSGAHTATVDGESVAYNVAVQPIVQVTNAAAGDAFTMDVTTSLNDNGYNADELYVGVTKIKVDGSAVGAEAEVAVTDGQTASVSVPVDNTDAAKYEIYVFIKDTQLTPIAKYTYQNGAITADAPELVLGGANEITVDGVVTDNINRVAKISGTVENGGARLVVAKLACNDGITFAGAISDETGAYTITAPYTCNSADVNDVTNVSVYAQLSSAVGNDSYSAMDDAAVAAIIATAKAEITDAAEMKNYLTVNPDVAAVIGVDLAQEDFAKLNPDNQTAVLNKVYALLMADSINAIPNTFETESKAVLATQRTEEALDKISNATSSTLTAILREYKTELGISNTIWNDYEDLTNAKKAAANEYFLDNVKVNNPAGIPDVLEDAIDEAENPSVTPTKKPQRDNGGSGISISPVSTPKPTATPTPTPTPTVEPEPTGFVDLEGYAWAEESINALAEMGIISGVGDNMFAPGNNVTREQFVTMLVKAAGLDNTDAVSTFTDVNPDDWFYTSVAMGEEAGLVAGSDGKFGVGQKISRQDMAVFIYRAGVSLGVEFGEQNLDYVDAAEISDYALEAVGAVSGAGIMSGVGDNTFAPKGDCTRAMAARVIYGLLQLMK